MNQATAAMIIEGVAALAPYLAQLGELAVKAHNGTEVTVADLARAESARRQAFAALRHELNPAPNPGGGPPGLGPGG